MNINVTKPYLPAFDDYISALRGVWSREWLTNNGPLVHELENKLRSHLDLEHVLFTSNGTVALQLAIRALDLTGEVITTPFSYVATTSSLVWERCTPVMVDIDPETLMLDARLIERAITGRTTGIVATHVFGGACDVSAIQSIAEERNLKVIYDAAHCFGTRVNDRSIFGFGDISVASFHATKLFHTVEGGALFPRTRDLYDRLAMLRNFGHVSATEFGGLGINGKNSELHAAMGLCNLPMVPAIIARRRELSERYDRMLTSAHCLRPRILQHCQFNYAYYPVIFRDEQALLRIVANLNTHSVFPRRYFYPSLDTLPYLDDGHRVPNSRDVASRILCLPLFHTLSFEEIDMICTIIRQSL